MNFRFSDSSALSDGNYSVSAKELLTNAKALAARLQEAKLSRIGLLAGNSLGWVTVDLACLIGDVCLVPIPTFFSNKQRDHVVDTCALQAVAIAPIQRSRASESTVLLALLRASIFFCSKKKLRLSMPSSCRWGLVRSLLLRVPPARRRAFA